MSNKKYTTQPRKPDFEDDFFLEPKGYEGEPKKDKLPKGQSIA